MCLRVSNRRVSMRTNIRRFLSSPSSCGRSGPSIRRRYHQTGIDLNGGAPRLARQDRCAATGDGTVEQPRDALTERRIAFTTLGPECDRFRVRASGRCAFRDLSPSRDDLRARGARRHAHVSPRQSAASEFGGGRFNRRCTRLIGASTLGVAGGRRRALPKLTRFSSSFRAWRRRSLNRSSNDNCD